MLKDTHVLTVAPNTRNIQTNLSVCDDCTGSNNVFANMDEVRIWTRPLSAAEILNQYNQCLAGNETNLLVYYRCNQVGPNVIDDSGNGYTGDFTNLPGWSSLNAPVLGAVCDENCEQYGDGHDDDDDDDDDKATGIEKQANQDGLLKIYPNPSSGSIKVSSKQPGVLTVYSVTGQILSEIQVQKSEQEVRLEGYKAGIYLYVFISGSSTRAGKLIIE